MNENELNNFCNSGLVFSHLLKNKNVLTLHLEDGTKLSGRLLGWDADYLLILYGKTLQMVSASKLLRLQAELENIPAFEIPISQELPKPKIKATTADDAEVNGPIITEKKPISSKDNPPARDRLDHLVRNW